MIVAVPDLDPSPTACRSCGAPIVWAATPGGAPVAVDLEPVAGGPLELYAEYFPDGSPVDDIQRVRGRPPCRPPHSPAWQAHQGAPWPCEPDHPCSRKGVG